MIGVLAEQGRVEAGESQRYVPLATCLAKRPCADELDEIVIGDLAVRRWFLGCTADDFRETQNRQTQQIFNVVMGAIASISLLVGSAS